MKAGVVLAFPHLEFMPHFQSHPSHTWLILASPLGLKKPGTRKPLRIPGLGRALGLGVDTTCSLLHLGAACALLSASQRPGRRLFWVNLGQRRLPSAAVSFIHGHIQLLVETRFQPFKKAAQTQQTPEPGPPARRREQTCDAGENHSTALGAGGLPAQGAPAWPTRSRRSVSAWSGLCTGSCDPWASHPTPHTRPQASRTLRMQIKSPQGWL